MNRPASRLLARLDAALQASPAGSGSDCIRAERAIYLARLGEVDTAVRALAEIRERYSGRPPATVACWLSLAEGLAHYFRDATFEPRDKLLRAQAMASSFAFSEVDAISSAWLAQLDLSALRLDDLITSLPRAVRLGRASTGAYIRTQLVVAQAVHFASGLDAAKPWYQRARLSAAAEGDDLSIDAVVYNVAWYSLGNLRQAVLGTGLQPESTRFLELAEQSLKSYDQLLGVKAFASLHPMLRAQVASLKGDAETASNEYGRSLDQVSLGGLERWNCLFLADAAWAKARHGDLEAAAALALRAVDSLSSKIQLDDLAPALTLLSKVFASLGDDGRSRQYLHESAERWRELQAVQSRILAIVQSIAGEPEGAAK